MARLVTTGFEDQTLPNGATIDGLLVTTDGTYPAIDTTGPRIGGSCMACVPNTAQQIINFQTSAGGSQADVFSRFYNKVDTTPSDYIAIWGNYNNTNSALLYWSPGNQLLFQTNGGVQSTEVGSRSTNTWYRIEVRSRTGSTTSNGQFEVRVDGVTVLSSTTANMGTVAYRVYFGNVTSGPSSGGAKFYFDDIAINDNTGASQNTWPSDGHVIHLKPTADSAVGTGFAVPGGGTTNLWDALNNTPPLGIADSASAGDAGKQIRNITSTTTANYDATLQTYTAAGIGASDTISLLRPICWAARAGATAQSPALVGVSNPAVTSATTAVAGTAGTFPTNWTQMLLPFQYAPSVTLGTAPVVRLGKRTATTQALLACQMGMVVEYIPASTTTYTATLTASFTPTPVIVRQGNLVKTATVTNTAAIVRSARLVKAITQTFTPTAIKQTASTKTATVTSTAVALKTAIQTKTATVTHTAVLVKQARPVKAASQAFTAVISNRAVTKSLAAIQTFDATVARQARHTLIATQSFTAAVASSLVTRVTLTASQTFTAVISTMSIPLAAARQFVTGRRIGAAQPDDLKNVGGKPRN